MSTSSGLDSVAGRSALVLLSASRSNTRPGPWRGRRGALAGLLLAALTLGSPAQAATVLKVDVAEATRLSEWVVRARVVSLTPVDLRDRGDSIYTDVGLEILSVYRGTDVPRSYVMRMMGGIGKDGLALSVPGMPTFAVGDDAVLFLEKTGLGHVPCGMMQGVWRVAPGPLGYPVVYRALDGLALMTRTQDGRLVPTTPAPDKGIKLLSSLVAEIRAAQQ